VLDRAQRKPVVEGEGKIAAGDEQGGDRDAVRLGRFQRIDHLVDVEVVQHVHEHRHSHYDDCHAEQETDPVPADPALEIARGGAQHVEHFSSGSARVFVPAAPPATRR
jgi:hypothetical protein